MSARLFRACLRTRIPNNESLKGIVVEGVRGGSPAGKPPKRHPKEEEQPPGGAVAPVGRYPPFVATNGGLFGQNRRNRTILTPVFGYEHTSFLLALGDG